MTDQLEAATLPLESDVPVSSAAVVTLPSSSAQLVKDISDRQPRFERVIMRQSEEIGELVEALAQASLEFTEVRRTLEAKVESRRTGAKYAYEYETLADVIDATRGPLANHGLVVMQWPFPGVSSLTLRTMLAHKSGQYIYGDLSAALVEGLGPQSVGSGITYLMRYARKAVLGIAAGYDDDDAAATPGPSLPQPGRRRSAAAKEESVAAQPTEPLLSEKRPLPWGRIADVHESGAGVVVTLDTGYVAATRDAEMIRALRAYRELKATIELTARASRDPQKYAPTIEEIVLQRR